MNITDINTLEDVLSILREAREAAALAAQEKYESLGGKHQWPCGFAWVDLLDYKGKKLDGRTKIGRLLRKAGIEKSYSSGMHMLWNPSGMMVQNMGTLYSGAEAAVEVLKKYGFKAYASSRMD